MFALAFYAELGTGNNPLVTIIVTTLWSAELLADADLMEACYDLPENLAWQYAQSNRNWLDSRR